MSDFNTKNNNTGDYNSGCRNSGSYNTGDRNSFNSNSGHWNSGCYNSGCHNSGDFNSGDFNSGFFNSDTPTVRCFNKETGIQRKDFKFPNMLEFTLTEFKDGKLVTYDYKEAWKIFWSKLNDTRKSEFINLPNFDSIIFKQITGIYIHTTKKPIKYKDIQAGQSFTLNENGAKYIKIKKGSLCLIDYSIIELSDNDDVFLE